MAIDKARILAAAKAIAAVEHVGMDPRYVVEDAILFAEAFPEAEVFDIAVANLVRTLTLLVRNRITPSALKHQLAGWHSCHFQHRVGQGVPADCRIIYRQRNGALEVLAFGHRSRPADIYERTTGERI